MIDMEVHHFDGSSNNGDLEYLKWVKDNPNGFIINYDKKKKSKCYPMIHLSTHKSLSTPKRKNYTTGEYSKICSNDKSKLEKYAEKLLDGKLVNRCQGCMK